MHINEMHSGMYRVLGVFYKIGLWKYESEARFCKSGKRIFFVNVVVSFILSLLCGAFLSDSREEFIFFASLAITIVVRLCECIYILWKKAEILTFLRNISTHSLEHSEELTEVTAKINNFVTFANAIILMAFGGFLVMAISCLPAITEEKRLPLNINLPWDWRNDELSYWISYTFLVCAIFLASVFSLLTTVKWFLMLNCAIKYQLLGNQFKRLGTVRATKVAVTKKTPTEADEQLTRKIIQAENENVFLKKFIDLIKAHRNIRETINEFKSFFAKLFFVKMTTSGICICSSIYSLRFTDNLLQSCIYAICLVYTFFDIFMVTYLGNEVTLSSHRLSYCLFESNWTDQSLLTKKHIIVFTEMLKESHQLIIGKLYPINLGTFTSILNFTYSSWNILKKFR